MKIELTNDDCHNGDDMQVWLCRTVRAIVKTMASPTPAIAEREVWGHVRQGFELRKLQPIDPEDGKPIEGPGHLAEGVVTFDALADWGYTKGYEFQMTVPALPDDDEVNGYADSRVREILLNGVVIDWQYWTRNMPKLQAPDAARLMSGLDPDKFPNLNEKPGRGNPADAIESARKNLRLAEAQGISVATHAKWVQWAEQNDVPVFPCFLRPVSESADTGGNAINSGAGGTAVSRLPAGIPTGEIVQGFKLTAAWKSKLTHIKSNPFLKDALMRAGCRKKGKTPATPHLWNPVVIAEFLIGRDGRNRRAMEAIITNHFADWQDVWHESMESDEADEFAA